MNTRWQFAMAIVSIVLALTVAAVGYQQYDRLVSTVEVPVAAMSIEPYTILTPAMLTTKELPRALHSEAIYLEARVLVGRITTIPLKPGMLIYQSFALEPGVFRLSTDPTLEVVSFPVNPTSAVGGQVRRGHRINIYRAIVISSLLQSHRDSSPEQLLEMDAAAAEVLAENVTVVDVRSQQGVAVQTNGADPRAGRNGPPLQIITVAVSPDRARELVKLVAEGQAQVQLWVTLAPLSAVTVAPESP